MGMQEIGYGGQPLPIVFRRVDPPAAVLIDLVALFSRQPHCTGRYHPHGLQLDSVVDGSLSCWGRAEHGGWWGLVTYSVKHGSGHHSVTHWAPAWVLKIKQK